MFSKSISFLTVLVLLAVGLSGCPLRRQTWTSKMKDQISTLELRLFTGSYLEEQDPFLVHKLYKELSKAPTPTPDPLLNRVLREKLKYDCMWPILGEHLARVQKTFTVVSTLAAYQIFQVFNERSEDLRVLMEKADRGTLFTEVVATSSIPSHCGQAEVVESGLLNSVPELASSVVEPTADALELAERLSRAALSRYAQYKQRGGDPSWEGTLAAYHDMIVVLNPVLSEQLGEKTETRTYTTRFQTLNPLPALDRLGGLYENIFAKLESRDLEPLREMLVLEKNIINELKELTTKQVTAAMQLLQ